jgi:hypothetical protein
MNMSTEHQWNVNEKGKTKYAKTNVPLHLHPRRREINIRIILFASQQLRKWWQRDILALYPTRLNSSGIDIVSIGN